VRRGPNEQANPADWGRETPQKVVTAEATFGTATIAWAGYRPD
jgi:hypothetical protein